MAVANILVIVCELLEINDFQANCIIYFIVHTNL